MHRKPGTDKFERVTWDFAMERIAKLMKDDRDANFVANEPRRRHRQPLADDRLPRRLRRAPTRRASSPTRSRAASAMLAVENQARI